MTTRLIYLFGAIALLFATSAHASPNCLKGQTPYQLDGDTVQWTMTIAPGTNCIQGLRWSFMQVYKVEILKPPRSGTITVVGSGFRYHADATFPSVADSFTIEVFGKNRRVLGLSVIEIKVGGSRPYMDSSMIETCGMCAAHDRQTTSEQVPAI